MITLAYCQSSSGEVDFADLTSLVEQPFTVANASITNVSVIFEDLQIPIEYAPFVL